jgi:hypothetical protein
MKKCCKCKIKKDLLFFGKYSKSKDGYRVNCKECRKEESLNQRNKNPNKEYFKDYYLKNKLKLKEYLKIYNISNRKIIAFKQKEYRKINAEKIRENKRDYINNKMQNDNLFKFKSNMRCRLNMFFKSKSLKKPFKTEKLLGFDYLTAKIYIENQFKNGMNWDNYGEWHIDHIKPLSLAKNELDVIELCNYKNLQPLWALENIIKGNRI